MKQYLVLCFILLLGCQLSGQTKFCKVYETRSNLEKRKRLDTAIAPFFFYTSPSMRPYLHSQEAISCYGFLSYFTGGYYLLNLIFVVKLANAPQLYGTIPARGELVVMFLDGKYSKLKASDEVIGRFDKVTESYIYEVQYLMSGNQVKWLEEKSVDRVRVTWSTGYEEYEVFDVDYLVDAFDCIQSHL
ncbi:MAG: hypothetical protein HC892_03440 [Saprospiraceae bacterium]|nr:hypothetical protein [Saprospiraceae bacterium]